MLNAGWMSSKYNEWGDEDGMNKWTWSVLKFTTASPATLHLVAHDIASKLLVFTTEAVLIAVGSCPANLTTTARAGTLPSYSLWGDIAASRGALALNNCEFSRVKLQFQPGTYQLAIW
jgi:hypothetical protein